MEKKKNASQNRLIIPSINVDAPLVFKKVEADGIMPEPDTPDEIVYHDLSIWPSLGGTIGEVGNAVFTGHVDSGQQYCDYGKTPPPCQAVLWDLDKVKKGDNITIHYNNSTFHYKVLSNRQQLFESKSWIKNIKKGTKETITIITCAGEFDTSVYEYKSHQIVKAIRIKI